MNLKHSIILFLASLSIFGYVQEASSKSFTTSDITTNDSSLRLSNQIKTLVYSQNKSTNINTVKSGTFISGEHTTQGTARIITKEGKSFIELDKSFKTSRSGPDLVVVLHRSHNVIASTRPPVYPLKRGDYIILAPLKKFSGAQTYLIHNNINLADYKSIAIWCRKFNATFGAANFSG
ncbi:DM13 domain-containing protein [Anabaena subtropica]|uniref:DM13 domain-containing protein n=1 Tax=Anabaena subtropica FACHB-260 TaxID=2692884 RepID=A0ABR8CXI8_9NOST|nr:DM13 domain-containing protein [Anabaena subtropica]MBD2347118.1 DM13 domain-containing protein [Anabaena subtropica FACHB-260]